eukprot:3215438-Pyramimonas_sp.AAC.1
MLIHVQLTCPTSSSTDRRADFLHDLHQQLTQHAHALRVPQHDQLPDRLAAYVAYLVQQAAIPHYSRHGGHPAWLKDAQRTRQDLLRQ